MARLSFRCDEELVKGVDAERGMIPREAWLRRAVEQALGGVASGNSSSVTSPRGTGGFKEDRATPSSTPAEQPEPWSQRPDYTMGAARSSAQVKRDIQSRPKGGK